MTGLQGRLAVLVAKPDAERAIAALREAGVYDDSRSVEPHDEARVALPVTEQVDAGFDLDLEAEVETVETELPPRSRNLHDLLAAEGWGEDELTKVPSSWAVIGTVLLADFGGCPRPEAVAEALLDLHGEADTVLARGGVSGREREPDVTVLAGEGDTETVHTEHGTRYALDLAEVMFSPGNKRERVRMGEVVSPDERVFDMFAGIGYFTLPMARADADVIAAEVNQTAYRYLVENAVLNGVQDRVSAFLTDCRDVEIEGADRAVMGYYDAHEYLETALSALRPGGTLHLHEATPESRLWDRPVDQLEAVAAEVGRSVEVLDRRVVKSHSEGVGHVVVDARVD